MSSSPHTHRWSSGGAAPSPLSSSSSAAALRLSSNVTTAFRPVCGRNTSKLFINSPTSPSNTRAPSSSKAGTSAVGAAADSFGSTTDRRRRCFTSDSTVRPARGAAPAAVVRRSDDRRRREDDLCFDFFFRTGRFSTPRGVEPVAMRTSGAFAAGCTNIRSPVRADKSTTTRGLLRDVGDADNALPDARRGRERCTAGAAARLSDDDDIGGCRREGPDTDLRRDTVRVDRLLDAMAAAAAFFRRCSAAIVVASIVTRRGESRLGDDGRFATYRLGTLMGTSRFHCGRSRMRGDDRSLGSADVLLNTFRDRRLGGDTSRVPAPAPAPVPSPSPSSSPSPLARRRAGAGSASGLLNTAGPLPVRNGGSSASAAGSARRVDLHGGENVGEVCTGDVDLSDADVVGGASTAVASSRNTPGNGALVAFATNFFVRRSGLLDFISRSRR